MKFRVGEYVHIVREVTHFHPRYGDLVEPLEIPAKVVGLVEDDSDSYWVVYYGPPHHFSKAGQAYGIYRQQVEASSLARREPIRDDPLEF